jgi:hypothetical protein
MEFLKTPEKRAKFTAQLAHFKHLNPEFASSIPGNQRKPAELLRLLVAQGAGPKCWVISENADLDGQEMDLLTALRETIGSGMGTFISWHTRKAGLFRRRGWQLHPGALNASLNLLTTNY